MPSNAGKSAWKTTTWRVLRGELRRSLHAPRLLEKKERRQPGALDRTNKTSFSIWGVWVSSLGPEWECQERLRPAKTPGRPRLPTSPARSSILALQRSRETERAFIVSSPHFFPSPFHQADGGPIQSPNRGWETPHTLLGLEVKEQLLIGKESELCAPPEHSGWRRSSALSKQTGSLGRNKGACSGPGGEARVFCAQLL